MENTLITFLASFLIWIMFGSVIFVWFSDGKIKKEQILHAILAAAIAWGIAQIIKKLFPSERPFELNGAVPSTLFVPKDGAFPSGHTAAAFALSVTFFLHDKKLGSIYLISSLLIGLARVAGNVHYPVDILGGAILGSLISLGIEKWHPFRIGKPRA